MDRNHELFQHIEQQASGKRALSDWVPEAEAMARKRGGALPYHEWLSTHGLGGLSQALRKHPSMFKHIPQEMGSRHSRVTGFRNGTIAQRRSLEIKHGLSSPRKKAA